MSRPIRASALAACLMLAGCQHANPSTGNDTEAALDPPATAAPQRPATQALAGIAMEDVQPETMSQADLDSLGGTDDRCLFRMDADGWPGFVYGGAQAGGIIKLNETLVSLPRTGSGTYADGGLQVTLHPLDASASDDHQQPANLVIRLPHTPQELGFQGYAECHGQAGRGTQAPAER
jgi:hypothetical protein